MDYITSAALSCLIFNINLVFYVLNWHSSWYKNFYYIIVLKNVYFEPVEILKTEFDSDFFKYKLILFMLT